MLLAPSDSVVVGRRKGERGGGGGGKREGKERVEVG